MESFFARGAGYSFQGILDNMTYIQYQVWKNIFEIVDITKCNFYMQLLMW